MSAILAKSEVAGLTDLAAAARVVRDALKDRSYRATPLGLVVGRYYRWKKNEWGATESTMIGYEAPLALLCIDHADLELADFEPHEGTELVREFLDVRWPADTHSAGTRRKNIAVLRDFFKWCCRERLMQGDPMTAISSPKRRGVSRDVYRDGESARIIAACKRGRDLCAVGIVCEFGIRKNELRLLRLADFDSGRGILKIVHGKGGRVRSLPVVNPRLRHDLDQHWVERLARPAYTPTDDSPAGSEAEYLLYPEHWGRRVSPDSPPMALNWENRLAPLAPSTLHWWWKQRLAAADVPHERKMHEMRHTALTDLLRASGNLELVRQMAGHASIQTTADIYAHLDMDDLAEALQLLADKRAEEAGY